MIVTWTITEGAVWDWTYSYLIPDSETLSGDSGGVTVSAVEDTGEGTFVTVRQTLADQTGTFYTSVIATTETTLRTTETTFNEEEFIYQERFSASYNETSSQIVTFYEPTTATKSASSNAESTLLSVVSSETYIKPFPIASWIDVDIGDEAFAPTVAAWSSAMGFFQPIATNQSSVATGASLAFSGQMTVYPLSDVFEIPSATDGRGNADSVVTETRQSTILTWTRQTQTATTLTISTGEDVITAPTDTYDDTVLTTRSTSSAHTRTVQYLTGSVDNGATWASWWESTVLAPHTFIVQDSTISGSTTSTSLVSAVGRSTINMLEENQAGQQPLGVFEISQSILRGRLQFGKYSHFYAQNAGHALNATQTGGAAFSYADASFPLPGQSFLTALYQREVTVPLPYQTRSNSSSNSTTSWSLGFSKLSITTRSSNAQTSGSTSSTYALSVAAPSLWSTSSRIISQSGNNFTAAGGYYASNSVFVGGGLFTATGPDGEFTGTAATVTTAATAFAPLPHFAPEIGFASVQTLAPNLPISQVGFLGLRILGYPLTA